MLFHCFLFNDKVELLYYYVFEYCTTISHIKLAQAKGASDLLRSTASTVVVTPENRGVLFTFCQTKMKNKISAGIVFLSLQYLHLLSHLEMS